jgi:hypothetical protein
VYRGFVAVLRLLLPSPQRVDTHDQDDFPKASVIKERRGSSAFQKRDEERKTIERGEPELFRVVKPNVSRPTCVQSLQPAYPGQQGMPWVAWLQVQDRGVRVGKIPSPGCPAVPVASPVTSCCYPASNARSGLFTRHPSALTRFVAHTSSPHSPHCFFKPPPIADLKGPAICFCSTYLYAIYSDGDNGRVSSPLPFHFCHEHFARHVLAPSPGCWVMSTEHLSV